MPVENLYDVLTKDGYRMRKPRTCSRNLYVHAYSDVVNLNLNFCTPSYDLMLKCWALDPNDRPKFHELVEFIENEEVDVIENVISMRT